MTRSKWFASILGPLLLLGAVAAFFYFRGPRETPVAVTPATATAVPPPVTSDFARARPMERVRELYELESKRVGQVDPDPALTEQRLTLAARDLSPAEVEWLGTQALNLTVEMDARFFATYFLALGQSPAALATLKGIALSPIPRLKNERRVEEERVLRMQAVEGMSRNCAQRDAKAELLDVVGAEDEAVRDRAHRALYACQTGKKIEDGDKAALEKLQAKP